MQLLDCLKNIFRSLISTGHIPQDIAAAGERLLEVNLEDNAARHPICAVGFGMLFEMEVAASNASAEQARYVEFRCQDFPFQAAKQVHIRLTPNAFEFGEIVSPDYILSQAKPPLQDVRLLKLFKAYRSSGHPLKLCFLPWKNATKNDIGSFWVEVLHFMDASGESHLSELEELALLFLATSLTNVDVERAFSHMNLLKSRLRNGLRNEMLSGILHVRYRVRLLGVSC